MRSLRCCAITPIFHDVLSISSDRSIGAIDASSDRAAASCRFVCLSGRLVSAGLRLGSFSFRDLHPRGSRIFVLAFLSSLTLGWVMHHLPIVVVNEIDEAGDECKKAALSSGSVVVAAATLGSFISQYLPELLMVWKAVGSVAGGNSEVGKFFAEGNAIFNGPAAGVTPPAAG
jgi:hypothetical protein